MAFSYVREINRVVVVWLASELPHPVGEGQTPRISVESMTEPSCADQIRFLPMLSHILGH